MSNATITLEIAQSHLALWLDADAAIAEGKEFWMNGQRLIYEDADKIAENISKWSRIEAQLLRQAAGRPRWGVSLPRMNGR